MSTSEIWFEIITLCIIAISAFFVWLSIHRTNKWNRKKGAQEILNQFIMGEIPELNKMIKIDFNCKIYDHENDYKSFTKNLNDKDQQLFDDTLLRMLNIFEVIAINIKNKIIKENICWEYAGWFYTEYYRFSKELILDRRKTAGDGRVFENFEHYAKEWLKKMQNKSGSS